MWPCRLALLPSAVLQVALARSYTNAHERGWFTSTILIAHSIERHDLVEIPSKLVDLTFKTRSFDSKMGQGQSQQPAAAPEPQISDEERAQIQAEV
jgi:hypothetical protein